MQVKLDHLENLHFKASVRDFEKFDLDEPKSFHGTNLGPSPVEYLLIGIGGCLGSSFMYCLNKKTIKVTNLKIVIDGKIKHKGPTLRLRLVQVDITILYELEDKSFREKADTCINEFKQYCVVSDSLVNGIPLNIECKEIFKKNI